jgi:hypothetical protein
MFFNRYNELCVNYGLNTKVYHFAELKPRKHQRQQPGSYIYGAGGEEAALSERDLATLKNELSEPRI